MAGKVALITGAGAGIAKASALLFSREGAKVAVCEVNAAQGRATESEIRALGGEAHFIHTDVTDEMSVRNAVAETVSRLGPLTVLFNCVGTAAAEDAPCTEVDMALWEPTFARNVLAPFLCCRHGIPELIKAGGGSVINMSSWVAACGNWHKHIYTAAKGAVVSLTRALAGEYSKYGIRVNAIAPGVVRTERTNRQYDNPQWNLAVDPSPRARVRVELARGYPFSVGEPDHIAHTALFLASDESHMINGTVIMADGGRSAY
ncbi:MAG: SDR family oxidoreductase [Betaproteobacteria bacterium]|nr:SDR family oxidoreductase [Betaproteobacteria bacterium]